MARGTTLGQLVSLFRDEAGFASTAAMSQNVLEAVKTTLRRTQDVLYEDWSWPHLRVERDELLKAGERYYSFPPDLNHEKIEFAVVRESPEDRWTDVVYGITPGMRNDSNSELDDRRDPVLAWQYYEDEQYEVWPMPATDGGTLRFTGLRKVRPLVKDSDRADLDDRLIVLYAAGQWLRRAKDPSADVLLQLADTHYRRIKANSQRRSVYPIQATSDRYGYIPIQIRAPGT
jgi:hypothetical protein